MQEPTRRDPSGAIPDETLERLLGAIQDDAEIDSEAFTDEADAGSTVASNRDLDTAPAAGLVPAESDRRPALDVNQADESQTAAHQLDSPQDRRRHRRAPVMLRVSYESAGALKSDFTENISRHGLFIATTEPFVTGQAVQLELCCAGLPQTIPVDGTVRWVGQNASAPNQPPTQGIGVQFDLSDPVMSARIESMVDAAFDPIPPAHTGERLNVLLIEPNPHARQMYASGLEAMASRTLHRAEYVFVITAPTASAALMQLEDSRFSLVLTELGLPDMDGFELITRVRALCGDGLPICAMAHPFPGAQIRTLDAGADVFVRKPVVLKALFNTLKVNLRLQTQPLN